jgi:hypothetical protein
MTQSRWNVLHQLTLTDGLEPKMTATRDEIERRENSARDAIKRAFGTKEDEFGATLFVSHHLDEIEESYWQKHLGTSNPEPSRVLDILELRSHWGDEEDDGIDTFDFTLPESITQYVISVRFGEMGQVEQITMES